MEKVLSGQTNLEISYEGAVCTIEHVDSGDVVVENAWDDRVRNLTFALTTIDCNIRTRYAEHVLVLGQNLFDAGDQRGSYEYNKALQDALEEWRAFVKENT